MIKKNVGTTDRILRYIGSIIMFYLSYTTFTGFGQIVGYFFAVMWLVTATIRFCPTYTLFGINTCNE